MSRSVSEKYETDLDIHCTKKQKKKICETESMKQMS